jgi:hypothetical protein
MKQFSAAVALLAFLQGCAGPAKAVDKNVSPMNAAAVAGAEKARQAKEKPPVQVGTDVIVEQKIDLVWPILIKVEDWGSWMPKVTKVEPGAGLSPGAQVRWQWEEKEINSEIVSVKEKEEFSFKSTASSKKAVVKWTLKPMGPGKTLVSLRALVPYGTASETMAKLGPELTEWITSLQNEALKAKDEEQPR